MFSCICLSSVMRMIVVSLAVFGANLSVALSIGVVDEIAIINSSTIQDFCRPTQAEIDKGSKELESLVVQIQQCREEFDKNESIMDSKVREQQRNVLSTLAKQFQIKAVSVDKKRSDAMQKTQTLIKDACVKTARQKNLDVILSNKAGSVLYAQPSVDVTAEVMKALPSGSSVSEIDRSTPKSQ